jgi:hypothetical protein
MHKNLKKVISSIAALALSASSFVALAATSYPDVAESANYYKAVTELSALNVINGYEDGTFGPEKLVTRAEITKMIVAALGPAYTDAANAAAGQNTKFTDVTASHWAAGFVTEGTTVGFIAGMGDGTFAPNSNVTFAQATTMLVRTAGYEVWAKAQGYPQGYMSYGSQLEITKGVNVDNNTELNRGQVAILIDNTLDAPILKVTSYEVAANGESVPKYTKMDGSNSDYPDKQTILTENHNASRVYGRVTGTATSDPGLDADKVMFRVEKSYNWMDNSVKEKEVKTKTLADGTLDGAVTEKVYLNGTDADKYLDVYAEAIIRENDDDEFELVSFFPSAKVETVALKTNDYSSKTTKDKYYTYTDANHSSTKYYNLSANPKVYVNGVEYTNGLADAISNYVDGNIIGDITLMDVPAAGQTTTDGKYDTIMITYYADAIVDSVVESATSPKIYFTNSENGSISKLEIKPDDTNKSYKFTLDGAEIKYTDLEQDDIVSIAYDVVAGFADSNKYDVIVSRNTATGTVDSVKTNKTVSSLNDFLVGGEYYTNVLSLVSASELTTDGTEYTLYLDAFGRIAKVDEGTTGTKKIAILDAVTNESDTYYATIYTADGQKIRYQLKDSTRYSELRGYVYAGNGKTAPQDRVFKYSVNSKNEITLNDKLTGVVSDDANETQEYKLDTYKVGSIRLNSATAVLDATDYKPNEMTYDIVSASLVDGDEYVVYGFDKNSSDGSYRFAIITKDAAKITTTSKMAVVSELGTSNVDGEQLVAVTAYTAADGANEDGEITLYIDLDVTGLNTLAKASAVLKEGTPFYYTTNSDGYMDRIDVLNAVDYASAAAIQKTVFGAALTGTQTVEAITDPAMKSASVIAGKSYDGSDVKDIEQYKGTGSDRNDKAVFKFAPIVKKSGNSIFFATGTTVPGVFSSDTNDGDSHSVLSGATVLVCDLNSANNKISRGSLADVTVSRFTSPAKVALTGDYKDYAAWNQVIDDTSDNDNSDITYALVKMIDGDITEIYVIQPED